ncbi:hypothetical protein EVAR_10124_1 [Eumeta japonica]|uniref:Mos1 transposase HTH domain-containing protein n=1 Tax=Eumeta variegata TaxID=151549 RepID=A0A4C1UC14_EUMVA|nr:hypothetical protein EVAR_10124_1 [Eumeta japonica]
MHLVEGIYYIHRVSVGTEQFLVDCRYQQSLVQLRNAFGDEAPCKMTIYNWFAEFKRGHVNPSNELRDGCPSYITLDTDDETWIYCCDPKTKQQSTVRVYRDEPKPAKVARERSAFKRIIASYFNKTGHLTTVD